MGYIFERLFGRWLKTGYIFDYKNLYIDDPRRIVMTCFNKMNNRLLPGNLKSLLSNGYIGGDLDWGIHLFDEHTEEDFGVKQFDGYRFYLGPDEHELPHYLEAYLSANDLKKYLRQVYAWYMRNYPAHSSELPDIDAFSLPSPDLERKI